LIEGVYAVRPDAGLASNDEVDRPGVRIAVGKGAAYDLFLTRSLKHATLVRGEHSFETFLRDKLEAVAGIKQAVVRFVTAHPEVRLLDGRFMEIAQAMCLPKGRPNAARYLAAFVEEMKASGFVAEAITRAKQEATVAPPAN
jgi:polar amino acid transport system substrate-binding protein